MTTTMGQRSGKQKNLTAEALGDRATGRRQVESVPNPRPAIVEAYNFAHQRVDVKFKDQPDSPVIRNVPIERTGRPYGLLSPLARGHVGLLVPLWTDARNAWEDDEQRLPTTRLRNTGISWVFVPGTKTKKQALPDFASPEATSSDIHLAGPRDAAMYSADGKSGVIFKEGGEVVFIGTEIYLLGDGDDAGDSRRIARQRDGVVTSMGGGVVVTGSNTSRTA